MIFETLKGRNYGFRESLFNNSPIKFSVSRIGSLLKEGKIGPVDCGAMDLSKRNSLLKAFSESLERRSLMIGSKSNHIFINAERLLYTKNKLSQDSICTFELINGEISSLPIKYSYFNSEKPYIIDTTGTASHSNSNQSLMNSLCELFEKNSTFLFWYGKIFRKLNIISLNSSYFKLLKSKGYEVHFFVQEMFLPLKIVFVIATNHNHITPFKFMTGVGSHTNLIKAIEKALSETLLLINVYDNYFLRYQHEQFAEDYYTEIVYKSQFDKNCWEHISEILSSNCIVSPDEIKDDQTPKVQLKTIISSLPKWIRELHSIIMPQFLNPDLLVLKVFSPDLFNHAMLKEQINLDLEINKRTLNLSERELSQIPECPIL